MTERELRADLRVLVQRWETIVAQSVRATDMEEGRAAAMEDCIDDLKELLV